VNDVCRKAIELELGDSVDGDTEIASSSSDVDLCGSILSNGPGLFYKLVGSGDDVLLKVDSNFYIQISLFSGGSCSALSCVDGTTGVAPTFTSSQIAWKTVAGQSYFVFVNGFDSQKGQFTLWVENMSEDPSTTRANSVAVNDNCKQAIELDIGDSVSGDTEIASSSDMDLCGSVSSNGPGLFYMLVGSGNDALVNVNSNFYVQISVFSGDSCDALSCVDGTTGLAPTFTSSQLVWKTVAGQYYFIFVNGFDSQTGKFTLLVDTSSSRTMLNSEIASLISTKQGPLDSDSGKNTSAILSIYAPKNESDYTVGFVEESNVNSTSFLSENEAVDNSQCQGSERLVFAELVMGTTNGAFSSDTDAPLCGSPLENSTVWYRIRARSSPRIEARLFSTFDARLTLFKGDACGNLECVDQLSGSSYLFHEWNAVQDQRYYIAVDGNGSEGGAFRLTVLERPVVPFHATTLVESENKAAFEDNPTLDPTTELSYSEIASLAPSQATSTVASEDVAAEVLDPAKESNLSEVPPSSLVPSQEALAVELEFATLIPAFEEESTMNPTTESKLSDVPSSSLVPSEDALAVEMEFATLIPDFEDDSFFDLTAEPSFSEYHHRWCHLKKHRQLSPKMQLRPIFHCSKKSRQWIPQQTPASMKYQRITTVLTQHDFCLANHFPGQHYLLRWMEPIIFQLVDSL